MKKILPVVLICISLCCRKSIQTSLQVRVQNRTNISIDSVHLTYDVTNYDFGIIDKNKTTSYHLYQSLPTAATATFVINGQEIFAGRLFPPNSYPYPALPNGNYTLQIFADSTLVSGFNAEFIKQ